MIPALNYLREMNTASVILRLILAVVIAGTLGIEREQKLKPAGFRTYSFVCLGAALTIILSQYEFTMISTSWAQLAAEIGIRTDVSRFGAQVINGIGFLGAGTVIVTGRQEVKGLTTAAGLWASACIGLAIGAGFYEAVVIGFLLIFLSMRFLTKIESTILLYSRNMNLYAEFTTVNDVADIISLLKKHQIQIYDVEISRGKGKDKDLLMGPSAVFYIQLPKQQSHIDVISAISELESVSDVEEI
ncbi:MAG: MgtC/SapB family protein [Lachnospiraceae bacterium]|nr:MgtC/SapB family protein [Lachnospiraceae bacterium]MCI1727281.1 MgtC/SapB family protein [Lachnospiraceae bacterium]